METSVQQQLQGAEQRLHSPGGNGNVVDLAVPRRTATVPPASVFSKVSFHTFT